MDTQDFEQYISGRYDDQIRWHDRKAATNKRWYLGFQTSIVILSVVTSVMTALDLNKQETMWWVTPVVASALVAILTGLQKIFQLQELWIEYRMIAESLRRERYLHMARVGEYATLDSPNQLFVERVEEILSRQNRAWATRRSNTGEEQSER